MWRSGGGERLVPGSFPLETCRVGFIFFPKSIFILSSADNVKGDFANIFVNTKLQRIFFQTLSSIRNQLAVVFFQPRLLRSQF